MTNIICYRHYNPKVIKMCNMCIIPYSGKVWWGKSLAKLANLAKLQVIRQLKPAKPVCRPVNHRHSSNFSSPKLLDAQFAKLFPHQTFPLYGTINYNILLLSLRMLLRYNANSWQPPLSNSCNIWCIFLTTT